MGKITTKRKRGKSKLDKEVHTGAKKIELEKDHQKPLSSRGNSDPYYFMKECKRRVYKKFNNNRYFQPGKLFCIF